jgi:hypothetical protein
MNIRELSKQIASIEHGKDIDELDEKEIKRVYTALQQSHLPKLDDLDLIEFNKDNGNIRILPRGKNMVEMKVETVYNGMSMPLRAVLFAGTFVISVTAFTSAGIVEQITTYALPALILILMSILLLPPNKSNNKTNPPKDIDTSSETNTRATKF